MNLFLTMSLLHNLIWYPNSQVLLKPLVLESVRVNGNVKLSHNTRLVTLTDEQKCPFPKGNLDISSRAVHPEKLKVSFLAKKL